MTDNDGIRTEDVTVCQVCGETGHVLHSMLKDALFGVAGCWKMMRCPRCRLVWLNPRPVPADLGVLYRDYSSHGPIHPPRRSGRLVVLIQRSCLDILWGYRLSNPEGVHEFAGRLPYIFPFLRDRIGSQVMWLRSQAGKELLDVGCGDGGFMAAMRDLGWKVTGVEPDPEAARKARFDRGLDVRQATLDQAGFPEGRFDVVTIGNVLEHVPDGLALLREGRRLLKPGGRMVVLTPNPESLGHRIFGRHWLGLEPPRHFVLYPPGTLRRMAGQAGFRVEELRTTVVGARDIWLESRRLRRDERVGSSRERRTTGRLSWISYAFYLLEYILSLGFSLGEETLLIAVNPSRTGR